MEKEKLRKKTVETYYRKIDFLLGGNFLLDIAKNIEIDSILENLAKIKYKNDFSQNKNAFLYYCYFANIKLEEVHHKQIEELEKKTIRKYRKIKSANLSDIEKSISKINNEKLKLCYETMLKTGLRVSELSDIKKSDCMIKKSEILFYFIGKGGEKEKVKITKEENPKLFEDILMLIEGTKENEKLFLSKNYLQQKAKENNFQCHDLRRSFAKCEYKKTKSKIKVKNKLRHKSLNTTHLYLKSKINID